MNDDLREDLRSEFDRQQAGLGELRGSRQTLVKRALENRDEPIGDRLPAAAIAALVITAIVIGVFAYVRSGIGSAHHGPPITASPSRIGTPVPQAPVSESARQATQGAIIDTDLVDASTGWVLISNCISPMTGQCHYSVARTVDGGQTWSKAVQVGPMFDPSNGDAPRHVHFMNARDGFVYGGSEAYVTHDGGQSWRPVGVRAVFFTAATGRGNRSWAITYPCAKGVQCAYEVRTSIDAGRTWSSTAPIPAGFSPAEAIPFSNAGLLIAGGGAGDIELTLDGGSTWTFIKSRCPANNFIADVATSDATELWELCIDYPSVTTNESNKVLFVSEDRGKSWSQRTTSPTTGRQLGLGYLVSLVSPRPGTAVIATNESTIAVTIDGGRTWTDVGPSKIGFMAIQFGTADDGWALDVYQYLWSTHDGGKSWSQLPASLLQVTP